MTTDAQENIRILPKKLLNYCSNLLNGFASLLIKLNFTPNSITVLALLIGAGAGAFFAFGYPIWGGIFIILCGIFDVMDGKVAVRTNRKTLFGAIFDSTDLKAHIRFGAPELNPWKEFRLDDPVGVTEYDVPYRY